MINMYEAIIIIFLMGISIGLLILEIFLLPGITIAGIGGVLFALGGLFYAYSASILVGNVTLGIYILLFGLIFTWLLRSKSFDGVALKNNIDSKLVSSRELGIAPGDTGITLSRLAPIGKARIKGITVEAKSLDELIDENTAIRVLRVDGYNVIVTKETNTPI
ncbi:MAG: NfeD family protein [Parabacteroides sp.]|nr:NfeD family protein [Parabacteroides sp.]